MSVGFAGQRALITGASGFLGSHLAESIAAAGGEVHATSRRPRESDSTIRRWWQLDLSDPRATLDVLAAVQPDLIFHLAGHVSAAPALANVLPAFDSLLASTVNLLTAACEARCARRIVLTGSMMEPDRLDATPEVPYAAAKWAATMYGRLFHSLYELPTVIVRPSMTYGPRQPAARLVPFVIRSVLSGTAPRLSNGHFVADWTYVDDMIEGIMAAARAPRVEGLTIDLGTGTTHTAREVVELTLELMESSLAPVFGALPDRPGDRSRVADIETTQTMIDWTATTSLRDGVRRTIDWFTAHTG